MPCPIQQKIPESLINEGFKDLIKYRGGRNRTLLWSFGDSYSTDELHPFKQYAFLHKDIYTINQQICQL